MISVFESFHVNFSLTKDSLPDMNNMFVIKNMKDTLQY